MLDGKNDRKKTSQISDRSNSKFYGRWRNVQGSITGDGSIVNLFVLVQASFVVSDVGPCGTTLLAGGAAAVYVK